MIELLNYLHELPPNETLSGVNQRISTSTESVIEILDKLRQETTTPTTTTTLATTTTPTASTDATETLATSDPTEATTISDILLSTAATVTTTSTTSTVATTTTTTKHKRPLLKDGERSSNVFAQGSKLNSLNETITVEGQLLADDHQHQGEDQVLPTDPEVVDQQEVTTQAEVIDLSDVNEKELQPRPDDAPGLPQPHQDVVDVDNNTTSLGESGQIDQESEPTSTTATTTTTTATTPSTTTPAPTEAPTVTTTTSAAPSTASPDDEEEFENEATSDEIGKCFNSSDASADCNVDNNNNNDDGLDVVLIAGVTVGAFVCVVIIAVTITVWFCRKSHHRKNVYATMEEEQPKEFTKAGPPVILQDELVNPGTTCGSRYHFRNSDKVTEL